MFLKYAFHAVLYGRPVLSPFHLVDLVAEKSLLSPKIKLKRFVQIFTFRPRLPVEENPAFIHCTGLL
jgi:hypothetical protein